MTYNDVINSKINGTKATFQEETSNTMLLGERWPVCAYIA